MAPTAWLLLSAALAVVAAYDIRVIHPPHDGIITSGHRVHLTLQVVHDETAGEPPLKFGESADVCLALGTEPQLFCYDSPNELALQPGEPGTYDVVAYLVARPPGTGLSAGTAEELEAAGRLLASDEFTVTAEANTTCSGKFGLEPCGVTKLTCGGMSKFRFFLYEVDRSRLPGHLAAYVYDVLAASPFRTMQAAAACIFVGLTDLHVFNLFHDSKVEAALRLSRLPLWLDPGSQEMADALAAGERTGRSFSMGRNHLILHYGDYHPGFDVGRGILAKSSFGDPIDRASIKPVGWQDLPQAATLRPGYDIIVPMPFFRCGAPYFFHLTRYETPAGEAGRTAPMKARPILASFRGTAYGFPDSHWASVRERLLAVHNGKDVIIALSCHDVVPDCLCLRGQEFGSESAPKNCGTQTISFSKNASCSDWEAYHATTDFDKLMFTSKFAIVAPGEGTHSYRLYEALGAGAVPVLLGASVAPFDELIDWPQAAVVWPDDSPAGLKRLISVLRSEYPTQRIQAMREYGRLAFVSLMADFPRQIDGMFAVIAKRFNTVLTDQAARMQAEKKGERVGAPPTPEAAAATAHTAAAPSRKAKGPMKKRPPPASPTSSPALWSSTSSP